MFKKLFGNDDSGRNKRSFMRVDMKVNVCIQLAYNYQRDDLPTRYGKCFMTRTVDVSGGGMAILHLNQLLSGETILLRTARTLLDINHGDISCAGCKNKPMMSQIPLTRPIVAKVTWRTAKKCGLMFLEYDSADQDIIHKMAWDQHLDDIRSARELYDEAVFNKKAAEIDKRKETQKK